MASKSLTAAVHNLFNNSNAKVSKTAAQSAVNAVFATIGSQLMSQGRFSHPGIGTFRVKHVAQRNGRNPSTGAKLTIPAHNVIRYKAPSGWDLDKAKVFKGHVPAGAKAAKPAAKAAKK